MNTWPVLIITLIAVFIALAKYSKSFVAACALFLAFGTFSLVALNTYQEMNHHKASASINLLRKDVIQAVEIKDRVLLDMPIMNQLPELPRGCEVTTLAMLLASGGVNVDKMELAQKIQRDSAPYRVINGKVHFGNPHKGFVGDMYTFDRPGLGVYHEPVMKLGEEYLPGSINNITGSSFNELKIPLSQGKPIWVIINAEYRKLPPSYFEEWQTKEGPVKITKKEHSVLITGYDAEYVYFNDPLTGKKNKKAPIQDFAESWVQMGSQALTLND